jgi:transposase-like protein
MECTPKLIQKTKPKNQRKGKEWMRKSPERYTPELKLGLVRRLLAGEVPATVAQETGVPRRLLYHWRDQYREHGPDGLKPFGRPRKRRAPQATASSIGGSKRIAELERKVGHQELVIDFFEAALHRFEDKSIDNKHAGGKKCTP